MTRKFLFAISLVITAIIFYYTGKNSVPTFRTYYPDEAAVYLSDTLSQGKLSGDYDFYRKTMSSLHPGLYKWHSKKEITALFDSVAGLLTKTSTRGQFYTWLNIINNRIGCSHTNINFYKNIEETIRLFPIPFVCIDTAYYSINCEDCLVPKGSRLLAINGIKMEQIAERLKIYESVDGGDESIAFKKIPQHFPLKYFLAFGDQQTFKITAENPVTHLIKTDTLVGSSKTLATISYWHPFWWDDFDYDLQLVPEKHTAILKLRTFTYATNGKHEAFSNFIKNSFRLLSQNPSYTNLILDLRNNRGGENNNSYLLYSYLAKNSFWEDSSSFMNNFVLPVENSLGGTDTEYIDSLKSAEYKMYADSSGLAFIASKAKKWERAPDAFKGNVYIITNSITGSASIRLAALLNINDSAKIVGEKPNGIYWGATAYFQKSFLLPNSDISFTVPLVSTKYNLKAYPYPLTEGLKPDYTVPLTLQDFLNGEDTQIKFIWKHLVKN